MCVNELLYLIIQAFLFCSLSFWLNYNSECSAGKYGGRKLAEGERQYQNSVGTASWLHIWVAHVGFKSGLHSLGLASCDVFCGRDFNELWVASCRFSEYFTFLLSD